MRESEKSTRFLRDDVASPHTLPKAVSYDDLVATGEWVEMYGESNLVSKDDHNHVMVLHEGAWRVIILEEL